MADSERENFRSNDAVATSVQQPQTDFDFDKSSAKAIIAMNGSSTRAAQEAINQHFGTPNLVFPSKMGEGQSDSAQPAKKAEGQAESAQAPKKGDGQSDSAQPAKKGDEQADSAQPAKKGDGQSDGAPTPKKGDGQSDGAPTPKKGDGQSGSAPTPKKGDGQSGSAPTPKKGDGQSGSAPTPKKGEGPSGRAQPPPTIEEHLRGERGHLSRDQDPFASSDVAARPERKQPDFAKKEDPRALNPEASVEKTKEFLAKGKKDVDYKSLINKDTPVLFAGDDHLSLGIKDELIKSAKDFKAAGVTHFGIEMIPEKMNKTLDKYYDGDKAARAEVLKYLKDNWDKRVPGVPEKIMDVMDAMKKEKIRPVGIDSHDHAGEKLAERNENWAKVINETLKNNPGGRMVVFGGVAHTGYGGPVAHANEVLSEKHGIKSTVVDYAGGIKAPTYEPWDTEGRVTQAAAKGGLADKHFQIPLNKTFARPADYIVHLPQKQELP